MSRPRDPERFDEVIAGSLISRSEGQSLYAWQGSASGLAAVWARENTREALWDAMARKEVYATTGTRLMVRVFAGYDFMADDLAALTTSPSTVTRAVCRWAATCRPRPPARRRRS